MDRITVDVGLQPLDVFVGAQPLTLPVGTPLLDVAVGAPRVALDVPTVGRLDVAAEFIDAPVVTPHLVSCHLNVVPGLTRCSVTLSVWSHLGKIRYSCWDYTMGLRTTATTYSPATAGLSYAAAKNCTGLVIGHDYRLDYWLDCIPDVDGYTEGWYMTDLEWTQPSGSDPPIDRDYMPS